MPGHSAAIKALLLTLGSETSPNPFTILFKLLHIGNIDLRLHYTLYDDRSYLQDSVRALGRDALRAVLSNPKSFDIRTMTMAAAGLRNKAVEIKYHVDVIEFLRHAHLQVLSFMEIEAWNTDRAAVEEEYKALGHAMSQQYQYYLQVSLPRTQTQFEAVVSSSSMLRLLSNTDRTQINARVDQLDAANSLELAKSTTADSRTMKTLAALGILYLPTTLVSSIFSTVFFNVESNQRGLEAYKTIWILLVTAILLTLATFAMWA